MFDISKNYIADNPKMVAPPSYWMQRLWDFDDQLVVLPSRQRPYAYVLARRCKKSRGIPPEFVADPLGDTAMCSKYHLVNVRWIYRYNTTSWSIDNIIRELHACDAWRYKSGDEHADAIDAFDEAQAAKKVAQNRDMFYGIAGDDWIHHLAQTGQRTKLNRPTPKRGSIVASGSTAGSGPIAG